MFTRSAPQEPRTARNPSRPGQTCPGNPGRVSLPVPISGREGRARRAALGNKPAVLLPVDDEDGEHSRMALKNAVNLANLEALGARRLAELLLELGAEDARTKRR